LRLAQEKFQDLLQSCDFYKHWCFCGQPALFPCIQPVFALHTISFHYLLVIIVLHVPPWVLNHKFVSVKERGQVTKAKNVVFFRRVGIH